MLLRSRWLTNLLLLAAALGLGWYAYDTEQARQEAATTPTLSSLSPAAVDTIRIERKQRLLALSKQGDLWWMTSPVTIEANQFRINSLLKLLTTTEYSRYPVNRLDLDEIGINDSDLVLHLGQETFVFGDINPVDQRRYILYGDEIYLTQDIFYPLINSQLGTLVEQQLLPDREITSITTTGVLAEKIDGRWKSDATDRTDAIVALVDNWRHALAFGVHDLNERDSEGQVTIRFMDESELTFQIMDRTPWLILAREDIGLEYHLDSSLNDALFDPEKALTASTNPEADN